MKLSAEERVAIAAARAEAAALRAGAGAAAEAAKKGEKALAAEKAEVVRVGDRYAELLRNHKAFVAEAKRQMAELEDDKVANALIDNGRQ